MDDFTWQVTRNTLWKVARDFEDMDNTLLKDVVSPILSALGHTIDNADDYIDSNASNWQALEDQMIKDIFAVVFTRNGTSVL